MTDTFTHSLDWNGREWWVTTQKNGQPHSGMPLTCFVDYAEAEYRPALAEWSDPEPWVLVTDLSQRSAVKKRHHRLLPRTREQYEAAEWTDPEPYFIEEVPPRYSVEEYRSWDDDSTAANLAMFKPRTREQYEAGEESA